MKYNPDFSWVSTASCCHEELLQSNVCAAIAHVEEEIETMKLSCKLSVVALAVTSAIACASPAMANLNFESSKNCCRKQK